MKKSLIFLLLFCLFGSLFAQDKVGEQEKLPISQKELLREIKIFLTKYDNATQSIINQRTDPADLTKIADKLTENFFASPATKVFNDLIPNGNEAIPIQINEYLSNLSLSREKGINFHHEVCFTRISQVQKANEGNFNYVEAVMKKQVSGKNLNDEAISFDGSLTFFISFETQEEIVNGLRELRYKTLLIRKIQRTIHDIDSYFRENPDLKFTFSKSRIHLQSQPTIQWQTKFTEGEAIVELIDNQGKAVELASNIAMSKQKYQWSVKDTSLVKVGQTYRLKVSSLLNPNCLSAESKPFEIRPKIKKGKWIAIGSTALVGSLILLFKNQIFPLNEPLLATPPNNPK